MNSWNFSNNVFLNATSSSYPFAMNVSTFHYNALEASKSDPLILGLLNTYRPIHMALKTNYDAWKAQGGIQQSETLNVNQLLNLLAFTKIGQWDVKIQNLYPKNTPMYKKLLPHYRRPFQTGKQMDRISALKALSQVIGTDETLAAIKTDVDNFYTLIDTALSSQKVSIDTTKNKSGELETARINMCIAQYADMGALMQKFAATPEKIEQFFDLSSIRSSQQISFTGHLKPGEIYTIVKHTFSEDDEIMLTNPGTTQLKFYLATVKDMQPGSIFVLVSQIGQTVSASSLGKLTDSFLMVQNTDPVHDGNFHVELLE